jgi:hypothetical protein
MALACLPPPHTSYAGGREKVITGVAANDAALDSPLKRVQNKLKRD